MGLIDHAPHPVAVNFDRLPLNYGRFIAIPSVVMSMRLKTMDHSFRNYKPSFIYNIFITTAEEDFRVSFQIYNRKCTTQMRDLTITLETFLKLAPKRFDILTI